MPTVASKLIDDMKNDFKVAGETLKNSAGHSLTAVSLDPCLTLARTRTLLNSNPSPNQVWLDCISCCQDEPEPSVRCTAARTVWIQSVGWPSHKEV